MKVLITGGAGFIGLSLCKRLSKSHDVTILDLPERFTQEHRMYRVAECDITDYKALSSIDRHDIVFHLAAQSSGFNSHQDPEHDIRTNALGTLNVAKWSALNNVDHLVYASSMAVYGNGESIKENDSINPTSYYGISKYSGELYVKNMTRSFDVPHTILRLFNVYGPGQDMSNKRQGMLSIYLEQALRSDTIRITGSKDRFRDCVYIDDVVNAFEMTMSKSEMKNNVYNVGSGKKSTVEEIISHIYSSLGRDKFEIEDVGGHTGDQIGNYANNEKISKLGWKPLTSIEEGIDSFCNFLTKEE